MSVFDDYTGKPLDHGSDKLSADSEEVCDVCGAKLINRCFRCGAPVCCPRCCTRDAVVQFLRENGATNRGYLIEALGASDDDVDAAEKFGDIVRTEGHYEGTQPWYCVNEQKER